MFRVGEVAGNPSSQYCVKGLCLTTLYSYKMSNCASHCLPDEKTFVPRYPYLENEDYNNSCAVGLRLR